MNNKLKLFIAVIIILLLSFIILYYQKNYCFISTQIKIKKNMLTIITLPEDFISEMSANASDLFTDLSPILTLVFGIILLTIIISLILSAIRH